MKNLWRKFISVERRPDKKDEIYWTILIFPGTPKARGFCLRKALDGYWKLNGKEVPFYESRERVWQFRLGIWLLWVYKNPIKAFTESSWT